MIYDANYDTFIELVEKEFGLSVLSNQNLAPYTTYKIGGTADLLITTNNSKELENIIKTALGHGIPITVLGGGSNTLISDDGLRGLVIINSSNNITFNILKDDNSAEVGLHKEWIGYTKSNEFNHILPRHKQEDGSFYSFSDLDYEETGERHAILFDAGVRLSVAVSKTIMNGYTGLQWFAGIPGTMGGALFNNIHGGTKHFSDNFVAAKIVMIDDNGSAQSMIVDRNFFEFGYDQSVLRGDAKVYVLEVLLGLFKGDTTKARYVSQEWLKRKRIQPHNSPGCMFKNISQETADKLGFASTSVGYIIDKQLGYTGKQIGGVQISTDHANFFVNTGDAKAQDVVDMVDDVKKICKERWGLSLETEISFLGFGNHNI